MVKLSDETIAMVVKHNENSPLKPIVKVFYSLKGRHYLAPEDLNLGNGSTKVTIEKAVVASDYKINFKTFFEEKIAI